MISVMYYFNVSEINIILFFSKCSNEFENLKLDCQVLTQQKFAFWQKYVTKLFHNNTVTPLLGCYIAMRISSNIYRFPYKFKG